MSDKANIQRDRLPPGGVPGVLWLVEGGPSSEEDTQRLQDTNEREFEVRCQFSKEAGFDKLLSADVNPTTGSSFFRARRGLGEVRLEGPQCEFRLLVNADGDFGGALARLRSNSVTDARHTFLRGLMPALDHLSYLANTPLTVSRVSARDLQNGVVAVNFSMPYDDVTVVPGVSTVRRTMAPVYALYREAKNSVSHFYRFLCYFKILEGIFDSLRPELFAAAKQKGIDLKTARERIPEHPELKEFQPEYVGRPVKDFVDAELRKKFRDAVAHFLLESGVQLNPSDPDQMSTFGAILLPTELAVRVVVDQQEEYYRQFDEATRA